MKLATIRNNLKQSKMQPRNKANSDHSANNSGMKKF